MLLAGSKKSLAFDSLGEGGVALLPTEPEDMVSL